MTKFIKVTEQYGNNLTYPLLINCDCIRTIKLGEKGKDTIIYLTNDKYFFVKETVDQIWFMINTDMTSAPILMTADEALKYDAARDGV